MVSRNEVPARSEFTPQQQAQIEKVVESVHNLQAYTKLTGTQTWKLQTEWLDKLTLEQRTEAMARLVAMAKAEGK